MNENDLFLYGLIALSAAMLFFMYRSNKKRQTQAREMQDKLVEGAEVMTNFGLFGKVVSIDRDDSKVVLETSPKNQVTVHLQAVGRVIEPETAGSTGTTSAKK